MRDRRPIRVLSIVGGNPWGGIELWVLDVLRHIDKGRFSLDVMVSGRVLDPGLEERVRGAGGRAIHCPFRTGGAAPWAFVGFARRFKRALSELGPYDVLHDNANVRWLPITMGAARAAGVPVRIAHAHSMISAKYLVGWMPRTARAMYTVKVASLPRSAMVADATDILAVSGIAATDVFGKRVLTDKRYSLHPAGIDLAPFARGAGAHAIRASLGLEASGRVVGHVGRFAHQKNHEFFVRVAAQVARARQDVAFLLVGDGPLRRETEDQVRREGLADRFRLVGGRSDVAELMCGAMDVLLFPSRHEGMGRVVVEAQAAGLPCVMSDVVSPEVDVIPPLIHRHSLADPADEWADTVMGVLAQGPPLSHADAHALVTASPYSITTSIRALEQMYAAARRVDA